MHRRGVMHRDISPANVVVSSDGAPTLVDFALATSVPELRPGFTHPTEIVGTLAYLAPEATGRTGRSVDQRADLYALGATLYELATGAPPFGTGRPAAPDARSSGPVPVPPAEVNPAVPERCRGSSCTCWRRTRTTATRPPTAWSTTWSGCGTPTRRRQRRFGSESMICRRCCCPRPGWWAATRSRRAAGGVRGRTGRPLPGGAGRRRAGGGQDGAGRPAAPDGHRQRWLVRGRQVRPVPPGSGVRRGRSGVPRAGPAAAGRARGRADRRPRAAPGGARAERGAGRPRCSRSSRRCWGCHRIRGIR